MQLLPLEGFLKEEYWIVLAPLKLFCYPLLLHPLELPEGLFTGSLGLTRRKIKEKDLNGENTNDITQCKSYFMFRLGADVFSWKLLLKMHG